MALQQVAVRPDLQEIGRRLLHARREQEAASRYLWLDAGACRWLC